MKIIKYAAIGFFAFLLIAVAGIAGNLPGGGREDKLEDSYAYIKLQSYYDTYSSWLDEKLKNRAGKIKDKKVYLLHTQPYMAYGLAYMLVVNTFDETEAKEKEVVDALKNMTSVQVCKKVEGGQEVYYVKNSFYPDETAAQKIFNIAAPDTLAGSYELTDAARDKVKKVGKKMDSFVFTGYCPCVSCSGQWGNGTATGTVCQAGWTIAVDPLIIPLGSGVVIDNHLYHAEDVGGGIKGNHIDVFFNKHEEAVAFGKQSGRSVTVIPKDKLDEITQLCKNAKADSKKETDTGKKKSVNTEKDADTKKDTGGDTSASLSDRADMWLQHVPVYKEELKEELTTAKTLYSEAAKDTGKDIQTYGDNGMKIPLYIQWDSRWGFVPFGGKNIGTSGCSVTCLAMVISYLTGKTTYPDAVAMWCGNKYYVPGAGQSWEIFPAVAKQYGLQMENLGNDVQAAMKALSAGKPVIASMNPGTFTSQGHFIVLRGIQNGKILVNDPNDNSTKNFVNTSFEPSLIGRESAGYWAFSKK